MKKKIYCLIAIVSIVNFSFGQDAEIISGKINSDKYSVEIPAEFKSELTFKSDSPEFSIHKHYFNEIEGYVTVIADSKDKVVSVTLPSTISEARLRDIVKCFKNAFWGDGGGWSGFWGCVVN